MGIEGKSKPQWKMKHQSELESQMSGQLNKRENVEEKDGPFTLGGTMVTSFKADSDGIALQILNTQFIFTTICGDG